ncbi:hypothetical protein K438DRAFT_2066924 [Mycena galopus ATCC 62051]|nr:hypothetical protein K438DRAFT_2066924 [Mycena galopus ATCC 62051]
MSEATPVAGATDHALSMNTIQEAEGPITALYDAWDVIEWKSTDSPGRMHLGVKTLEGSVEEERESELLNLGSGCVVDAAPIRSDHAPVVKVFLDFDLRFETASGDGAPQSRKANGSLHTSSARKKFEYGGKEWGIAPALLDLEVDKMGNIWQAQTDRSIRQVAPTPLEPPEGIFAVRRVAPPPKYDVNGCSHSPAIFAHGPGATEWLQWLTHNLEFRLVMRRKKSWMDLSALLSDGHPRLPEPSAKAQASTDFADPDRPRSTDVVPCQPTLPTGAGRLVVINVVDVIEVSRVPERQSGVGVALGNGESRVDIRDIEGRVRRGYYCGFRIDLTQQLQPFIDYLTGGRKKAEGPGSDGEWEEVCPFFLLCVLEPILALHLCRRAHNDD